VRRRGRLDSARRDPPLLAADPNRPARFQREAEGLASLNHRHINADPIVAFAEPVP
jgi:hypothetical protein